MTKNNIEMTLPDTTFPDRPIKLIVPFSAGGGSDFQARTLEKVAQKHLIEPLVVLNKPGAAGVVGWNEVAHAEPDGYTLTITGPEVLLHTIYRPGVTHYLTSLDPIAQISTYPLILVVNAEQPWRNVDDLIAYGKQHPKEIKYGNSGIGAVAHIISQVFGQAAAIELTPVPFQGGSESIAALLGNHIQFVLVSPAIAKEHIKAGTLRAIATTGEKRLNFPVFADVPTLKESGIDVVFNNWFGIAAPKELPQAVKATLAEGFKKAIAEPEFQKNMENLCMEIEYIDNRNSRIKWVKEADKFNKMLHDTGILNEVKARQN